mgnify:CR=1 FL=1
MRALRVERVESRKQKKSNRRRNVAEMEITVEVREMMENDRVKIE